MISRLLASVGSRGDSYDNALPEAVRAADKPNSFTPARPGAASTTSSWQLAP